MVNIALQKEVKVSKGEYIEILCSATGVGADGFMYQWFLNDLPIADQDGSILVIGAVTEDNTGDYKCFVRNQYNGIGQSEAVKLVIGKVYFFSYFQFYNLKCSDQ